MIVCQAPSLSHASQTGEWFCFGTAGLEPLSLSSLRKGRHLPNVKCLYIVHPADGLAFYTLSCPVNEAMHIVGGTLASDKIQYTPQWRDNKDFFFSNGYIFHGIETGNREAESKEKLLARDFLGSRRIQKIGFPPKI